MADISTFEVMVSIFPDQVGDVGKVKNAIQSLSSLTEWVGDDEEDGLCLNLAMSGEGVADINYVWQTPVLDENSIRSLSEAISGAIDKSHLPYEISDVQKDSQFDLVMFDVTHVKKSNRLVL